MFKTTIISTFFTAAAAIGASAEPGNKYDLSKLPADVAARVIHLQQYGDRFDAAIKATLNEWSKPAYAEVGTVYDLSILPVDVAARVIELQKHGDRFEPVIRAIFLEAIKPTWGFDDCGHGAADNSVATPQS